MPGQFVSAQAADVFWWREWRLPPPDQFDAFLSEADKLVALLAGR